VLTVTLRYLKLCSLGILMLTICTRSTADDDLGRGFSVGYAPWYATDTELHAKGWFLVGDESGCNLIWQTLRQPVKDKAALAEWVDKLPKRWRVKLQPSIEPIPHPWTDMWPSSRLSWEGFGYAWIDDGDRESAYGFTELQLFVPRWLLVLALGLF
jgi:hypothetical protein